MYRALYREYRPEVFSEMLGQEHIVRILKNQISTDSTSHAYLFCGTRGTGKTTTARLLAKGLNCTGEGDRPCGVCPACQSIKNGTFLDVIEIDAASNNSVDNIRELRESVKYPPAAGRKKVYIIDEVHMLSTGAFNALLKTLEEPPEYVTFILATTEPGKLPATILSRCMRLDFKRVPEAALIRGMNDICSKKGINVSEDALRIIAANADGSVRDGLSILDQCIAGGDLTVDAEDVLDFLGASGEETFIEITEHVRRRKTTEALMLLAEILEDGKDVRQFLSGWINHYRNLLMTRFIRNPQDVINMSAENIERIRHQSEALELTDINEALLELSRTHSEARRSVQPRILLELAIVKLSEGVGEQTPVRTTAQKRQSAVQAIPNTRKQAPVQSGGADSEPEGHRNFPEAELLEREETSGTPDAEQSSGGAGASGTGAESSRQETGFDCEAVWKAVFDDAEAGKGSFYVLATDGHIVSIEDGQFTLKVNRSFQKRMAENNRDMIERLVAEHTDGARRHMKILSADSAEAKSKGTTAEETAAKASEILGIPVEIE